MKFVIARILWVFMFIAIGLVNSAPALDNALGLYYDDGASVAEIESSPNSTHSLYLILLNPVNENFDGGGIRDVD